MNHVKIPQDRVGALIGAGGETLREIESRAEVRLDVDSENGAVKVESVGDPVTGLKGPEIVRAIGRGFPPEDALSLLEDDVMLFDLIDIDAAARNKKDLQRKKGRLIGEGGRTRQIMEELSGASVVIYGSTMGVIGRPEQVSMVREAAEMLLEGAPHGAAYSFLERKHNEQKREELSYHRFSGGESA
jgi:ribosomal RNA assembly protein